MKGLLIIFSCIWVQTTFAQFGMIADKDGYVNIRKSPSISNNIIGTLANDQIVYSLGAEGKWLLVDYDFNHQIKSGYIHGSRVQFIDVFDQIPYSNLTDSIVTFTKGSIHITATKKRFDPADNHLQYHQDDTSTNEISGLEKINGKAIWGTDGNIPKYQYGQFTVFMGDDTLHLPIDDLFEPNLGNTTVHIDEQNHMMYISATNSDGAGTYVVLWIIEDGRCKQRITTIPY